MGVDYEACFRDLDEFAAELPKLVLERTQEITSVILETAVELTPVRTQDLREGFAGGRTAHPAGNLKANWKVSGSVGGKWNQSATDPSGSSALGRGKAVIASAKPFQRLVVQNRAPHALWNERGSIHNRRPVYMLARAVDRAKARFCS
jgi:hypothetical protein